MTRKTTDGTEGEMTETNTTLAEQWKLTKAGYKPDSEKGSKATLPWA